MSDYITTFTKKHFTPLEPKENEIEIKDIAHALSLMTRANGHFPQFYSVAQHCIHCCEEAIGRGYEPEVVLACLLHDASEAYLADITRPVKKNLLQYLEVEEILQDKIYDKYIVKALDCRQWSLVKKIDDTLLYYEFYHFMGEKLQEKEPFIIKTPVFDFIDMLEIEKQYLFYFDKFYMETKKALEEKES